MAEHAQPAHSSFWDKIREGFTIHFHFAPGWTQVAGALAMLLVGFFTARVAPNSFRRSARPAGGSRHVARPLCGAGGSGRVQIVVDETTQRTLSGTLDDQSIQRLLLTAAKDPSDAGLRVESVDLLKNQPQSAEIRSALLYAVQHDSNAGVRLKALDGLKDFADDPETRKSLTQVLLKDDCPGVRKEVIDMLIQHHADSMVGVLQEVMGKEQNGYIRMRCQRALHDMNASAEMY